MTTSLLALVLILGIGVGPAAAIDSAHPADTLATQDDDVPAPVCYDVTGTVNEEVPYDQVIWVDDLPEDFQPGGVPWSLVTPKFIASLALGVTPNQCDVFDPNDPPYDPREDDLDPDGGADTAETDEGSTLIILNGTLDRTASGPGGEATLAFTPATSGEVDPDLTINDGEKDYVADPGVRYWEDGTLYLEHDVVVVGKRGGVEFDCNGEECQPDVRGAPSLVDYPTVPSHTNEDHMSDAENTDAQQPSVEETPTPEQTATPEPEETDTSTPEPEQTTGASSAGGSGGGSPDASADESGDSGDRSGGDGQRADDESGGSQQDGSTDGSAADGSGEASAQTTTATDATPTTTSTPTLGGGPGFGVGAVVLALGAFALFARRGR